MNTLILILSSVLNPPDTTFTPGLYSYSNMVAVSINFKWDHSFKDEAFGCLGKLGERNGTWTQKEDTVFLMIKDTLYEKFLYTNIGLIQIIRSRDTVLYENSLNSRELLMHHLLFTCRETYYQDSTVKSKFYRSGNDDTVMAIGYYPDGQIEYTATYDRFGKPIGAWYFFSTYGSVLKTINYNPKKPDYNPEPDRKRKKRRW